MHYAPIATGFSVPAIAVNSHKFQTVMSLNQMEAFGLGRPSTIDSATLKAQAADQKLESAATLRNEIQRRFNAARKTRAELYSAHLHFVEVQENDGGSPAITIYVPETCAQNADGEYVIPYGTSLLAIDGETQTEARFILRENHPETGHTPIAVTVYHGITARNAKQILYDYNAKAHPVSATETASLNSVGPITRIMDAAILHAGLKEKQINRRGAVRNKKTSCSATQVLNCAAAAALGASAMKGSISSTLMNKVNIPGQDVPSADRLASLVGDVIERAMKETNDDAIIGRAPAQIWQVAGSLIAQGREPASLNWVSAVASYAATAQPGQGGKRMAMKDRLAAIAAAF